MNTDLQRLQPYPFQKLTDLFSAITPADDKSLIRLSIGEPRHAVPGFIREVIANNSNSLSHYPLTRGSVALREAIQQWLTKRYGCQTINSEAHILPVNGTREALFSFAQTVIDSTASNPLVMMPNPFYQIYEGAAILAGGKPYFMNCTETGKFLPDLDAVSDSDWRDCQLIYLCSPANPTGSVMPAKKLQQLIKLAHKYDFVIASDECYSEIYRDESIPPTGLLAASDLMGNDNYARCLAVHSLSKRSNLPGLRSGFVAGDCQLIDAFHLYRTYHGCAMSPLFQEISIAAWSDETHVELNRQLYREKFTAVGNILSQVVDVHIPHASFYLWLQVPGNDDLRFTQDLYKKHNVVVLPGSYLSRENNGTNPGKGYVRIALVDDKNSCIDAANRIADTVQSRH